MSKAKGRCTICGSFGKLTEDHVPPQSAVPARDLEVQAFAASLNAEALPTLESRPARNTPRFPTICGKCNGDRLGARFDPALVRFAEEVRTWVKAAHGLHLTLPPIATVRIQPALVARAVIGHLLAAEPDRRSKTEELGGEMAIAMRRYFMSEDLALPSAIRLLAWPYPGDEILIGRGIGHLDQPSGTPIVADVLKFFPIAFAVVSVEESMPKFNVLTIRPELAGSLEDTITVDLPLRAFPPAGWPERPGKSGIVLMNFRRVIRAWLPRRVAS